MPSRLNAALSPAAMLIAILALVVSAAGAGYAAATIGTKDIKNNAITAKKIKKNAVTAKKIKANAVSGSKVADRSLTEQDLVAEAGYTRVGAAGGVPFGNGTEGDCLWQPGGVAIPGLTAPGYRLDRSRNVHLAGVAMATDNVGGDANCDGSETNEGEDYIAFILPAAHRPTATRYFGSSSEGLIVVGQAPLVTEHVTFPSGAVVVPSPNQPALLDGIEFEAASSPLTPLARTTHLPSAEQARVLERALGLR